MKYTNMQKKTFFALVAVILVLATAAGAAFGLHLAQKNRLSYESSAVVGSVGSTTAADLEEMQKQVDRGMITISINAAPVWDLSDREAGVNWQIENPAEQSTKLIRVEVLRDDTDELIYQTGALRPGTYVTDTQPEVDLPEGSYSCTAYFYSYDIETQELLGKAGAQITLHVQS